MNGLLVHIILDILQAFDTQIVKHLATEGLRCSGGWHVNGIIDPVHPARLARAVCYIVGIPGQAHPAVGR